MAIQRGIVVEAQFVPNANGALLTPGVGITRIEITAAVMYANVATTGVELYFVPNAGSPSTTNRFLLKNFALDEDFLVVGALGEAIAAGGTLQGNDGGNGGTDVNIRFTITEFSGDS